MTRNTAKQRAAFRDLHQAGCFVLPNPWDIGSARLLQDLGFVALASTSSGFAWSQGRPDYAVTLEGLLAHLTALSQAVDLPINADFEAGFAVEPQDIHRNVGLAIGTGIAGLSIEDRDLAASQLFDTALAVERIRAARAAIDQSGENVILVARTELLLIDGTAVSPAIDKLVEFAEAGADCLFAPGVRSKEDIATMVKAVAPKPVNVLVMDPAMTVAELADLGVRRISVGGSLARASWGGMLAAAERIKAGFFDGLATGAPGKRLNDTFRKFD